MLIRACIPNSHRFESYCLQAVFKGGRAYRDLGLLASQSLNHTLATGWHDLFPFNQVAQSQDTLDSAPLFTLISRRLPSILYRNGRRDRCGPSSIAWSPGSRAACNEGRGAVADNGRLQLAHYGPVHRSDASPMSETAPKRGLESCLRIGLKDVSIVLR
jgi:hypothetical protein